MLKEKINYVRENFWEILNGGPTSTMKVTGFFWENFPTCMMPISVMMEMIAFPFKYCYYKKTH